MSLEKALVQHLAEKQYEAFDLTSVPFAPIVTPIEESQGNTIAEGSILSGLSGTSFIHLCYV